MHCIELNKGCVIFQSKEAKNHKAQKYAVEGHEPLKTVVEKLIINFLCFFLFLGKNYNEKNVVTFLVGRQNGLMLF